MLLPRRGLAALSITTVALALLLSFKTPSEPVPGRPGTVAVVAPGTAAANGSSSSSGGTSAAPSASATTGAAAPRTTATPGSATGSATVDGPVVTTRFGPVQVEVVVANGKLTDVKALQLPSGRHSGQISTYSAPILREEALSAQSAQIDAVSGATYTSDAYAQSLQAALDQAGIT